MQHSQWNSQRVVRGRHRSPDFVDRRLETRDASDHGRSYRKNLCALRHAQAYIRTRRRSNRRRPRGRAVKKDAYRQCDERSHFDRPRFGFAFATGRAPFDFCSLRDFAFDLRATRRFGSAGPRSRAQDNAARTARCHSPSSAAADSRGITGANRVNCLVPMNSVASRHTPPAIPARPAAPSAVVSIMSGRSTEIPSMSDWNCNNQLLADAPPSTRRDSKLTLPRLAITVSISAVPYAIASSAARATCALPDPLVRPKIVPRAFGSQLGAPSPTNAGTK